MRRTVSSVVAFLWLAACGGESAQKPPQGPTRADSVAMAAQQFDMAAFDTIHWKTPQEAIDRGNTVFRISCSKCHGDSGQGGGGFVYQGDTLRPPSFLAKDWRYANDPEGLRRKIFTGNEAGMPYWGLVGLRYRDIDAVARFITEFLRKNYAEGSAR